MRKRLELLFYVLIAAAVFWIFRPEVSTDIRTPRLSSPWMVAPKGEPGLPLPSYITEDNEEPSSALGTAFAIDNDGLWVTARHLAAGCKDLAFAVPGRSGLQVAKRAWINPNSDVALVEGPRARESFAPAPAPPAPGSNAYHVGFPRGEPGDVWSKVIGPARLVTTGRFQSVEPVIEYAEVQRFPALDGSLGGISGGPIFDADGRIIGVSVTESPRRGRITGAVPQSFEALFAAAGKSPQARRTITPALTAETLQRTGNRLRESFTVAMLYCFIE